jgi:hypothetical protein
MVRAQIIEKDHGWKELFKRAQEIKRAHVKVGVLADTSQGEQREVSPDGKPSPLTMAEIAAILEFGTQDGRIPPRSVARSTFDAKREELVRLGRTLIERVLDGKITVKQALNAMGATLANEMKRKITEGAGVPPPNAASTVAVKGSDRPWVDTGALLNAFTWTVEMGE